MERVRVWNGVTVDIFTNEIRVLAEPALMKGLVADWPIITQTAGSGSAALDWLGTLAAPGPFEFALAPPEVDGILHYQPDLRAFTYSRRTAPFAEIAQEIAAAATTLAPPTIAVQSLDAVSHFPGFTERHTMPLLPPDVLPRIWIGNRAKVATHNDPLDNIACVVAGRRRFTLFPPEQIGNLYMGPLTNTPAGTPISMVHVTAPDLQRYPRFAEALDAAMVAEMEPGDALYVPYQWFHHVEAIDAINVLVNYWWDGAEKDGGSPWDAMLHAIMAIRHLPSEQRRAWRANFDHYVFLASGDPAAHLPEFAKGALAPTGPRERAAMREQLAKLLR